MRIEEMQALREKHYNATVTEMIQCNEGLRIFRIKPDQGMQPWVSGQYTTLGLGLWEERVGTNPPEEMKPGAERKLLRRAYSISHSILNGNEDLLVPEEQDFYEFYINLVQVESLTPIKPMLTCRLFYLKEGSRVALGPKITGHYTLDGVKNSDQVLFFATGTGEAPHNAMIWELLRRGHQGPIVHSVTTRYWEDQGYRKIHEALEKKFSNFKTAPLVTREKEVREKIYPQDLIEKGMLQERTGVSLDPTHSHVFLCGSPGLIGRPTKEEGRKLYPQPKGMVEILETLGFSVHSPGKPGNVHFEAYW